jgi:abequosyltransferase
MEHGMTFPLLAICIPTHHGRAIFLREAVESVLSQLGDVPADAVTIHISDNASQDETQEMVKALCEQYPGLITYHRHETNLGVTANILRVMADARGDYGWMLSSDDRIAPGGLHRVWEALHSQADLAGLTLNFQVYDVTMTHPQASLPERLYPADKENAHRYETMEEALRECGSLAGYFSGQVYRRTLWQEAADTVGPKRLEAAGYFPYVLMIGEILKRHPRWMWLPEPLVENRLGNDVATSELNRNIVVYQYKVLKDMTAVWASLLGTRSPVYRELLRDNFMTVWHWRAICSAKAVSHCSWADEVRALIEFTRRLYFLPVFWLTSFPILLIPHGVFRAVAPAARLLGLARRTASKHVLEEA